jgi:hypothetical protein
MRCSDGGSHLPAALWTAGCADGRAECGRGPCPIEIVSARASARKVLGIVPYQRKGEKAGGWFWALPVHSPGDAEHTRL